MKDFVCTRSGAIRRLSAGLFALAFLLFFDSAVSADPVVPPKVIVVKCVKTMGGLDRLHKIALLSYRTMEHTFVNAVSLSSALPQILTYEKREIVLAPMQRSMAEKHDWQWTESPADVSTQLTVSPDGGFIDRGGKRVAITGDLFYYALDTVAAEPITALLSALDSKTLELRRETADAYEVSFQQPIYGVPIKIVMGIGKRDFRLQWIETQHSYDYDFYSAMWGDSTKRRVYSAWTLDKSGVYYPTKWEIWTRGQLDGQVSLTDIKVGADVDPTRFTIPENFKSAFASIRRLSPDDAAKQNLGQGDHIDIQPGLVMLPGKERAYNSLLVKQDRGLVIIEAPYSNANSEAIRHYAAKAFPNTPVVGVVSTNQIWLHIAGLPAYAKRGVPILLRFSNRDLVRRLLLAQVGDYKVNSSAARPQAVSRRTTIGSGVNRIELIPFEGGAGSRMLAVYFPGHRLLYCSDLYLPFAWGHQYWIEHLAEIRELIRHERLDVLQVMGVSTPPHDWADLIASVPESSDQIDP